MPARDPRIDAYIAKSADFAQPILTYFRGIVHEACPDIEETVKWGMPSFVHGGIVCGMAAFKAHCAIHFWLGGKVVSEGAPGTAERAMGQFGRVTRIEELPPRDVLAGYVRKAVELNASGARRRPAKTAGTTKRAELAVPDDLQRALRGDDRARATFEGFSPSHRRDYIEWITEAKREETRAKRIATTLEWLAEGKPRNWKYM